MKGRKPKTKEEHQRNGTYQVNPGRENKSRPEPKRARPMRPPSLKGDKIACKKWTQLCKDLDQLGIMATCDVDLMEIYCILFSQYRQALDKVKQTGIVLVTRESNGKSIEVKRNPFETVQNKTIAQLTKLMAEMGLTPTSRERLAASPQEENDPFLEFLEMSKSNN